MKVVVFQCHVGQRGTAERWPRFERPRKSGPSWYAGLMGDEQSALVGIEIGLARMFEPGQPARSTSGRSCSAACAVFFKAEDRRIRPPHRAVPTDMVALFQQRLQRRRV